MAESAIEDAGPPATPGSAASGASAQLQADVSGDRIEAAKLRARASDRWDALISGDFEAGYQFDLPSYRRIFDFDTYRGKFAPNPQWLDAKVEDIELTGPQRARIMVRVRQSVSMRPGMAPEVAVSSITEVWLQRDSEWWRVPPTEIPTPTPTLDDSRGSGG